VTPKLKRRREPDLSARSYYNLNPGTLPKKLIGLKQKNIKNCVLEFFSYFKLLMKNLKNRVNISGYKKMDSR